MDCPPSSPPHSLEESDEPQTPLRSPSRLDFCIGDLEDGGSVFEVGDDSAPHNMSWACTSYRDNYPYTFIEEDTLVADIAPLDRSHLLIVEGNKQDPPQATDSHSHENADTPHTLPVPREHPMSQVIVEPQAPVPVRPPSVQFQVDAQEYALPSRTTTQRLNYPHHGFSRSALLQQKTFWNSRHEEWAGWQSRMEQGEALKQVSGTNDAYTGLAAAQRHITEDPPPYIRTPPSGLERDIADHPPRKQEQDVHASIYPRVGDISALRDPYSVNIDRCFFRYPLWTLHKTLYVFYMHHRSAPFAPSASVYNTAPVQASASSSTLSSYTSSTSGDDESDSTLVADDSPVTKCQLLLDRLKCASPLHSLSSWNRCGWGLSWYARWELLIGLFQRDHAKRGAFDISMELAVPLEPKAAPLSPPGPIFRFTVEEDEDGDSDGDDRDDDYGTIVSNSSFSADFDEECERAIAFYSRESRCSGMAS